MNHNTYDRFRNIITILLILTIVFLTYNMNQLLSENRSLSNKTIQLEETLSKANADSHISADLKQELEQLGIANPSFIMEDLMNRPELISEEAVLGGTMQFERVYLLDTQWAIAFFSDGHILGYGLYEYLIDDDQTISWRLLSSTLL